MPGETQGDLDALRFELTSRRGDRWTRAGALAGLGILIAVLTVVGVPTLSPDTQRVRAAELALAEGTEALEEAEADFGVELLDERTLRKRRSAARAELLRAWRLELSAGDEAQMRVARVESERSRDRLQALMDAADALADGEDVRMEVGGAARDRARAAHSQALQEVAAARGAASVQARRRWGVVGGGAAVSSLCFLGLAGLARRRRQTVVVRRHEISIDGRRIEVADLADWRLDPSGVGAVLLLRGGEEVRVLGDDTAKLAELGDALARLIPTPDERIAIARERLRAAELQATLTQRR